MGGWQTAWMMCSSCWFRWMAVYQIETTVLECRRCGKFVPVPVAD